MYSTAEEQIKDQEKYKQEEECFRLATVTSLFSSGCAKVTFYGEESESEKEYSYLASYQPAIGDNDWKHMGYYGEHNV